MNLDEQIRVVDRLSAALCSTIRQNARHNVLDFGSLSRFGKCCVQSSRISSSVSLSSIIYRDHMTTLQRCTRCTQGCSFTNQRRPKLCSKDLRCNCPVAAIANSRHRNGPYSMKKSATRSQKQTLNLDPADHIAAGAVGADNDQNLAQLVWKYFGEEISETLREVQEALVPEQSSSSRKVSHGMS